MSASTDPARGGPGDRKPAVAWRPAGLGYLALCLVALLVGLYPQAVYPSRRDVIPAPLPTLQSLAAGQVLFILLVHPLIILRRARRRRIARYWTETVVESLTWLLATVPLYTAAAWLADATAGDVVRTVVCLLCLWPLTWSAGWLLQTRPPARPTVILLLFLIAALPAGHYITREFLRVFPSEWLWHLAPATFAWQAARSRAAALLPAPLWPLLTWPAVGGAIALVPLLPRRRETVNSESMP